jgi:hypothetical protein
LSLYVAYNNSSNNNGYLAQVTGSGSWVTVGGSYGTSTQNSPSLALPVTLSTPTVTSTNTPNGGKARKMSDEISTVTPTETITATVVPDLVQSIVAEPNLSTGQQPIQFRLNLGLPANVSLVLYNVAGEKIYNASLQANPGLNTLEWGLQNNSKNSVASGRYIYAVTIDGGAKTVRKIGKVLVVP